MNTGFREWCESEYHFRCDKTQEGAYQAWKYKQEQLDNLIEIVENFPVCMSCYVTIGEMKAGMAMKESILKILKGE